MLYNCYLYKDNERDDHFSLKQDVASGLLQLDAATWRLRDDNGGS
jgi:hypothetical protein